MKEFKFNITNRIALFVLLIISLIVLLMGTYLILEFSEVGIEIAAITALAVSAIVFYQFKSRTNKKSLARFHYNKIELQIGDKSELVKLKELKSYKIDFTSGVQLHLFYNNGRKFKIMANDTTTGSDDFELFIDAFEKEIKNFNKVHGCKIYRKKSYLENKWIFYLLSLLSGVLTITFLAATYFEIDIPASLYSSAALISFYWASYYKFKKKYKNGL